MPLGDGREGVWAEARDVEATGCDAEVGGAARLEETGTGLGPARWDDDVPVETGGRV